MSDSHFVFVVPMFNASKTLARMLHSLCVQSYVNWSIILVDDCSEQSEQCSQNRVINQFYESLGEKLHITWNSDNRKKRWEVDNVLYGISRCTGDDIVCRIDADDYLTDSDALYIINETYKQTKCDCLWTAHRWGFSDRNISGPLPSNCDVYKENWVSSHFKTFRKSLLNNVPYENFVNMNGDLIRRCGDQAIMLPALHKSTKSIYLPRVMYHYHIDEQGGAIYHTDDARFQKEEAEFIRKRGYVSVGPSWESVIK